MSIQYQCPTIITITCCSIFSQACHRKGYFVIVIVHSKKVYGISVAKYTKQILSLRSNPPRSLILSYLGVKSFYEGFKRDYPTFRLTMYYYDRAQNSDSFHLRTRIRPLLATRRYFCTRGYCRASISTLHQSLSNNVTNLVNQRFLPDLFTTHDRYICIRTAYGQ